MKTSPKKRKKPLFIFIHGFGTSHYDLKPLMHSFQLLRYKCIPLLQKGHNEIICKYNYDELYSQLDKTINKHTRYHDIYLIGFSVGGTLAIDYASKNNVIKGILSVSTFVGPTYQKSITFLFKILKIFRIKKLRRKLQTTSRKTKKELVYSKYIDIISFELIIKKCAKIIDKICYLKCPILFLHSIDDKVSSYFKLAQTITSERLNCRLVTFRELNHFIQFDIPSSSIRDLTLNYFKISKSEKYVEHELSLIKENYKECKNEERHWADIVFKIIVGFFSVFGMLLYFSLDEVYQRTPKAPYFLIAYSLAINIYILLVTLYFFYLNRIAVYLKHHLEPFIPGISFITYRTKKWISGKISQTMTLNVSMFFVGLPFSISIFLLIYCLLSYTECFASLTTTNCFMYTLFIFTFFLWCFNVKQVRDLKRYTIREVYNIPRPVKTTICFENQLLQLISNILPGCVKQPIDVKDSNTA